MTHSSAQKIFLEIYKLCYPIVRGTLYLYKSSSKKLVFVPHPLHIIKTGATGTNLQGSHAVRDFSSWLLPCSFLCSREDLHGRKAQSVACSFKRSRNRFVDLLCSLGDLLFNFRDKGQALPLGVGGQRYFSLHSPLLLE